MDRESFGRLMDAGAIDIPPEEEPQKVFAPIVPFESKTVHQLPDFPLECLPPFLRNMAQAAAENMQVDAGMTAVAGLSVMALCVQGKFIINPKPGWVEPLNLYAVIVARPSERKSPALLIMTRPLHDFEREENRRRAPLVDEFQMKQKVLRKTIANMEEAAAKPAGGKGKPVSLDEISALRREAAELEEKAVTPLRLLADDTTPEALASLMVANGGRMGVVSDEGGVFDILAGRYSNGRANIDVFLKAYSGTFLRVDRKGRDPEVIERPTLTMLLMVQPKVLEEIMRNREFAGRGFLARPLYALPRSLVGHRCYRTPPVPKETVEDYEAAVWSLLNIPDAETAQVIKLSPEADREAERFFISLEPRLVDELDDLEGWAAKLHGQIMRIAGVLHCCENFEDAAQIPVPLETMQAAEKIGLYFLEHTRAAFQIMGISESKEEKNAKYILRRFLADGRTELSKRELFRLCDGKIHNTESFEQALSILIERGYIYVGKVQTGGRPSEKVFLNPEAKEQKGEKRQENKSA